MICAIIEHGDLAGIRPLHHERRVVRSPAKSSPVTLEELALGNKGVELGQESGFDSLEFLDNLIGACAVEALGHELDRVPIKRKENFIAFAEEVRVERLEFLEPGFASEGGIRFGRFFVGCFVIACDVHCGEAVAVDAEGHRKTA